MIQFFCAPFEAEWQCISLIMDGVADCILSTDGDCVVLGAPKVVVELTISTKQCYIYDRSTVMLSLFVEMYNITVNKDYLPEMAAFLGCDYIKRLHGNNPNKVFNTILPGYRDAENKSEYILGLCGADQNYLKRFNCVTSLYQHTPVL